MSSTDSTPTNNASRAKTPAAKMMTPPARYRPREDSQTRRNVSLPHLAVQVFVLGNIVCSHTQHDNFLFVCALITVALFAVDRYIVRLSTAIIYGVIFGHFLGEVLFAARAPHVPRAPYSEAPYLYAFNESAAAHGYPVQTYDVRAADGHHSTLYRIQSRNQSHFRDGLRAVLVLPGINGAAEEFVANYEDKAIAYVLAQRGLDVWVMNLRGSVYERSAHAHTDDARAYYDFSFQEMATYDLPAALRVVRSVIGDAKVTLAGFSQGAATILAALSEDAVHPTARKALHNDTHKIVLLGPGGFFSQHQSVMLDVANALSLLEVMAWAGETQFRALPFNIMHYFAKYFQPVIEFALLWSSDTDLSSCHTERIKHFVAHYPAGTSLKAYIHIKQMANTGKFQKFDYGSRDANLARYAQAEPPEYALHAIDKDVLIVAGVHDRMGTLKDAQKLHAALTGSRVRFTQIDGGHMCYLIHKSADYVHEIADFVLS